MTEMLDFLLIPQSIKWWEIKSLVLCEKTKYDSICPLDFWSNPTFYYIQDMCIYEQFESQEVFTTSPELKVAEGADPTLLPWWFWDSLSQKQTAEAA